MERHRQRLAARGARDRGIGKHTPAPSREPQRQCPPLAREREGDREPAEPEVAQPDDAVQLVIGDLARQPERVRRRARHDDEANQSSQRAPARRRAGDNSRFLARGSRYRVVMVGLALRRVQYHPTAPNSRRNWILGTCPR